MTPRQRFLAWVKMAPEKSTQLKTEREHGKDSTFEGEAVFEYTREFDKKNRRK
jgi:hypothetical protein